MCYACNDDPAAETRRTVLSWPDSRLVVIASDAYRFRRYCREIGVNYASPRVSFIHTADPSADRFLRGLGEFEIHRVDGALARESVERILEHLVERRLAREFRGATPTHVVVNEAVDLGQDTAGWSRALRFGAARPRDEYTMTQAGQDLTSLVSRVNHETVPDIGMRHPHHWASKLERSPYWDRSARVLRVWTGDMTLTYRPEELESDVRYV